MICHHCGLAIKEDLRAFLYLNREHFVHLACARAYIRTLVPPVKNGTYQLIQEEILDYINGTAPATHTKYKAWTSISSTTNPASQD